MLPIDIALVALTLTSLLGLFVWFVLEYVEMNRKCRAYNRGYEAGLHNEPIDADYVARLSNSEFREFMEGRRAAWRVRLETIIAVKPSLSLVHSREG